VIEDQTYVTVVGLMLLDMLFLPALPPISGRGTDKVKDIVIELCGQGQAQDFLASNTKFVIQLF
jgi:hypothetical protein